MKSISRRPEAFLSPGAHKLLRRPLKSHSPSEIAGAEVAPSSLSAAMTPRVPRLSILWVRRTSASSSGATPVVEDGGRPSPRESLTGRTSVQTSRLWRGGVGSERVGAHWLLLADSPPGVARTTPPSKRWARDATWEVIISSLTTRPGRGLWVCAVLIHTALGCG